MLLCSVLPHDDEEALCLQVHLGISRGAVGQLRRQPDLPALDRLQNAKQRRHSRMPSSARSDTRVVVRGRGWCWDGAKQIARLHCRR